MLPAREGRRSVASVLVATTTLTVVNDHQAHLVEVERQNARRRTPRWGKAHG